MKNYFLSYYAAVVCLLSALILVDCNSNSTDPCSTYITLNSTNRQHTIHENRNNCDNNLSENWYKLEVNGNPAELPTACLKNNVCGTQLPLRLDLEGQEMPTILETLNASVCTSYNVLGQWDCCVLRQPVRVKNCGEFYVYYLKPTDRCPVAYCVNEIGQPPAPAIKRKRGERAVPTTTPDATDAYIDVSTIDTNNVTHQNVAQITNASAEVTSQNISQGNNTEPNVTESTITDVNATEEIEVYVTGKVITELNAADNISTTASMSATVDYSTVTTVENVTENVTNKPRDGPTENVTEALNGTTVFPDSSNQTVANEISGNTTAVTASILPCMNWPHLLCKDNKTMCYMSPSNNQPYIVCKDKSRCGELCDLDPQCDDGSDETNSMCQSVICIEGQRLCSDRTNCYTRCDGHKSCQSTTAGQDEEGCTGITSPSNDTDVTSPIPQVTVIATTELVNNDTEKVSDSGNITITEVPVQLTTITTSENQTDSLTPIPTNATLSPSSELSTDLLVNQTDLATTSEGMILNSTESVESFSTDTSNASSVSSVISPTTDQSATISNSTAENVLNTTEIVTSNPGVTGTNGTATNTDGETTVFTQTSSSTDNIESTTSTKPVISTQHLSASSSARTDAAGTASTAETTEDTTVITERTTGTSTTIVTTVTDAGLSTSVITTPSEQSVSTDTTQRSTVSEATIRPTTAASSTTPSTEISSSSTTTASKSDVPVTESTGVPTSGENVSPSVTNSTLTPVSGSTSMHTVGQSTFSVDNTSDDSSPTGPQPTSSVANQTDHTVGIHKKNRGLFYQNFGLFVFLVVTAAVITGICIFGLIGYCYRRRLRSWNPRMTYQDAYGDLEKKSLSLGREKQGIENPIPDFDIIRDEKKVEETSLSQASTLVLGQTPGRLEAPFDDSVGEPLPDEMPNGSPQHQALPQDNNGVAGLTNGQTNEAFVADDNTDGLVPVDELDTSFPRALFPWIESAADTKL